MITRRNTLAAAFLAPALAFNAAGCTPEQEAAALLKIKQLSAGWRKRVEGWLGNVAIAAPVLEKIRANDDKIQGATSIGDVLRISVSMFADALDAVAGLAGSTPVPAAVVTAIKAAARALRAVIGIAGAAPGERVPSLDEALAEMHAIPVAGK